MPQSQKRQKNQRRNLLRALRKALPDLRVDLSAQGLRLEARTGAEGFVEAGSIRALASLRERRTLQTHGCSFVDLRSGVIHVTAPSFYVHAHFPIPRTRMTAQECGLLAVLCELAPEAVSNLLRGPTEKLQRRLESITGEPVRKMAVTRLRSVMTANEIAVSGKTTKRFDRSQALMVLRESFRLRDIGSVRTYPIAGFDMIRELVESLRPACIEGAFRSIRHSGAHIEVRDVICSREATVAIRARLGPSVGPGYGGPTVIVRTAARVSVLVLAGKAGRDHLNPLLAAAALLNERGFAGEIGRELWETMIASK